MNTVPFLYVNVTALCCFTLMFITFLATKNGQTIYQVTDSRTSTEYDSDTLLAGIIRTATDEMTKNAKK